MKIVFLIDQIYKHGGAEKVLLEKSSYFAKKFGYKVTIITTEQKGKKPRYKLSDKVSIIDLKINYLRKYSYFNFKNLIKVFKHFRELRKTIKQINPDYVILLSDAFDYYLLPFITKSKILKEFHSSQYYNSIKRKENSFIKNIKFQIRDFINSKYNYLVLLTSDEKKLFNGNNTIVIPNGIRNVFSGTALLENKTVISAGRIAPVKNFEALIQTWDHVVKKYPDWQLKIFGEGEKEYVLSLKHLIEKLGLQNSICLCGATNDLRDKMLDASIYVMSSITECFPLVLLEAQACGLPIVSFDCPYGPRNIVSNKKDGLLVEDQNNYELAKALIQLISSKELRTKMGKLAKTNVQNFNKERIMNQWFALLEN